jgi:transposase
LFRNSRLVEFQADGGLQWRAGNLTDGQWVALAPLVPAPEYRADGHGRPAEHDEVAAMNGVLWIFRTGAAWIRLPTTYPSYSTCFRRFGKWVKDGTLRRMLEALAQDHEVKGNIDLSVCFIDGSFIETKKGAQSGTDHARPCTKLMPMRTLQVSHSPCIRFLLARMESDIPARHRLFDKQH